jgi:hypothetical protein
VPSLTSGRVCRLQLLLVLASAVIFRSESRETHDHILLSQIRDSPNLEGQGPVFISPRNRMARLYPQALCSLFIASYDSQGCGGGIRIRLLVERALTEGSNYFSSYNLSKDRIENTLPTFPLLSLVYLLLRLRNFISVETCFHSHCLERAVSSGSTIPALSGHVTIF